MTVSRETKLGTISISDAIFAQIILESFEQDICKGKVWPATRRGRQIGGDQKVNAADYAGYVEAERSMDGTSIDLEFSVIIQFGSGIRRITDAVADYIAEVIYQKQGKYPNQIKIRITGVRSRQIARRNLEVIKSYAAK
ncbi:hypothetical protein ACDL92_07060 [Ihubacter sp. mB4P-1]|uniref:hypothetical protein n=1 Tax=Ihubacter sp. mB4P-1 TaxID=3242370 RepID=UPI003C7C8267